MCNYNYGEFISEAVESVLNQTFRDFELIIVDDGSTDNSRAVIGEYAGKNPGAIIPVFKENGGQASAFNAGFRRASGEIVCFLDSDDLWYPGKLERITRAHASYDFVQHNMYSGEVGKPYRQFKYREGHLELMTTFGIIDFFVPTSGLSFKRKLLDRFFPLPESELRICADAYMTRMALFFSRLKCLDEVLGFYRTSHQSHYLGRSRDARVGIMKVVFDVLNKKIGEMGNPEIPFHYQPDPDSVREGVALYNRASLLERWERLDESEALFLEVEQVRAIRLKSGALYHLGVIHWKRKNYDRARHYFRRCLIFEPDHLKAAEYLAEIEELSHE